MLTVAFIGLQAALAERPKRLGGLHGSPQQRRPRRYRHEGLVCLLGKGPVGSL